MKAIDTLRARRYRAPLLFGLFALSVAVVRAADAPMNAARDYPVMNHSGWYDPYFGSSGKQLTDLGWISLAPTPRMTDAVRFMHRRADGNYIAIGQSAECESDWNDDDRKDGCRDVVSAALYTHDGIRVDNVGMANQRWLPDYTDHTGVRTPWLGGMSYFSAIGVSVPIAGSPFRWPRSARAEDSSLLASGKVLVLAEETARGGTWIRRGTRRQFFGCVNYEQSQTPLTDPPIGNPCMRNRRGVVLGFEPNLTQDTNLLEQSRIALTTFAGADTADGLESSCNKIYYSAIATNADRIFIGGHRAAYPVVAGGACNTGSPPRYTPFVIALDHRGDRDLGFGDAGVWSPGWPLSAKEGGVISDLQVDADGNLLVLGGRSLTPDFAGASTRFTTIVLGITRAGKRRTGFASNGELEFADMQFDPGARNMKLALAAKPPTLGAKQIAYVFSRYGGQIARIQDVATGLRDTAYGPTATGLYASTPDLARLPAFPATGVTALSDIVPVCKRGLALIGTRHDSRSKPMAVVLDTLGRRASNVYDPQPMFNSPANPGAVFDDYFGTMRHTRWGFGFAALFDASENKLLIGGSAGSNILFGATPEAPFAWGIYQPMFDFAISARQIRCMDVD